MIGTSMTLLDKLKKANDNYHEAVDDILMDEDVNINTKADFGCICSNIFRQMTKVNTLMESYYGES